ncbi:hypothetical protein SNE25_25070 [Mucilaginibacter sabulilitoris]|uniref:Uncharacterized protein n=1 Tax=Mucilaginibacter sabulilitoris TaxID=1173583 RepID=A0ABZ0TM29_9SPHI|nr:hypothetical protein [Mucilaginibacter sabulilitoris]WPU92600.1 hypothetical protein SNE25_25070 [Mucilaginibacter sabulilitoris]
MRLYNLKQNINLPYLKKQGNLIQFCNKKILVFDKNLSGIQLPQKLKIDFLYISGNPHIGLHQINKNYDYQTLIIDGNNAGILTLQLETEARAMRINYSFLRRNILLVATSN